MDCEAMMRHVQDRRVRARHLALFTAAALIASAAALPAQAQEEDKSLTENILTGLGLTAPTPPDIDYRERAPLVVPQNSDVLPPPRSADELAANPAWPKDPEEVARRKQAALDAQVSHQHSRYDGLDPRPLKPSQIEGGKRAGTVVGSGFGLKDGDNHISPTELEFKGWGNILNGGQEKPLVFTGEPEREALVQPPPGYQTPAPNAPYGTVEKKKENWKLPNWFDRTTPKD